MAGMREVQETVMEVDALGLAARVAARRIFDVIATEDGARVMYAIVDLGAALTSAIAEALAGGSREHGRIEIAIHPELAVGALAPELQTSEVATRFRNRRESGVVATVFSVPARQVEGVLQSLGTVERVNEPWLCDPAKAHLWAEETLQQHAETTTTRFGAILCGLMDSGILASAQMLAEFCAAVRVGVDGPRTLDLGRAVGEALPALRLPRECAPAMKAKTLAGNAAVQFRRWRDEFQPHLYLEAKDGHMRPRQELHDRLNELVDSEDLEGAPAEALRGLIDDSGVTAGVWRDSQQRVAELPWRQVQAFFRERTRKRKGTLGQETIRYLEDEFPNELSERDREILEEVGSETHDASPQHEAVFLRHRERLGGEGRLYKRWERFVFNQPVEEDDDLLRGLVRLAERACQRAEDVERPMLLVRLRGAEKMSFWTHDKNTALCAYLRDRYRGVGTALGSRIVLDFGRCWRGDWEGRVDVPNERAGASAQFEFEAFVVPEAVLSETEADQKLWRRDNRAQMVWKPGDKTFATTMAEDLRRVLATDRERAFLLRARVTAARSARAGISERATVERVTSITDCLGESRGALANPAGRESGATWSRVDELCRDRIEEYARTALTVEEAGGLREAFVAFHEQYTEAIRAIVAPDGAGLGSQALVSQAESYGRLLGHLRATARADILVRDVWEPLLQVGTATVTGDSDAMIVTPWHPLKLAELAAKAEQAGRVIERIVASPSESSGDLERYVSDRVQTLGKSYYANVGVIRTDSGARLLIETESRSGYSLLERPFWEGDRKFADEPVDHAVQKFGEIAEQYLRLRPHERANFSCVLLDAEADELPRLVAKRLGERIENEADLRCDVVVTHEDPEKLRQIYERQNRHMGQEVGASLSSEAGRFFLSRLRVGIVPPETVVTPNRRERRDVLLLYDVIARRGRVTWHDAPAPRPAEELRQHVPNEISRRRVQSSGGLSTSVYLTSPWQVPASQAYLDAMHDVVEGRAFDASTHFLPAQQVELASRAVADKLEQAHAMANWVVTYDRIGDRRLIGRSSGRPRILRYFSAPRSSHNVIVSTEVSPDYLRDRLREDLEEILPDGDVESLQRLVATIQQRSTSLSGSIVMRGAHWDNYAQELVGLIVAQREVELLLSEGGVRHRAAMFFLDEFRDWLDLSGEIADILAVDLHGGAAGAAEVRLVIVEAKCVGGATVSEGAKRSWSQLRGTYAAIASRFTESARMVDGGIWRRRLADMLVEHMDPWGERERVAGMTFEEWLDCIRQGKVRCEVSGHSVLSVRDKVYPGEGLERRIEEGIHGGGGRKLAQWRLGTDCIARTVRGIAAAGQRSQLYEPAEWRQTESWGKGDEDVAGLKGNAPSNTVALIGRTERGDGGEGARGSLGGGDNRGGGNLRRVGRSGPQGRAFFAGGGRPLSQGGEGERGGRKTSGSESCENGDGSERSSGGSEGGAGECPRGWKPGIYDAVVAMLRPNVRRAGGQWLKEVVRAFKRAVQAEDMEAPVEEAVLTPNSALLHVAGRGLTVRWLENKRTDLMTRYGVEIIRVTPMAGRIAVALKRPRRGILHLSEVWTRRAVEPSAPTKNMALVVGEREDDGALFYLSLEGDFAGREQAAPHTLVSGTTGSGKGMLVSNLILDVCAFNDPRSVQIYLIDPKRGADYLWARDLPHLREGIVDDKDGAVALLRRLVGEMEQRYCQITDAGCANIAHYNHGRRQTEQLPRVIIFFDEVANWMQDGAFKREIDGVINEIATKSRAAGLHLIMVYQRADKDVMTMQLRTNLGNKLILRLGDEGSSRIALGERGAEDLQGRGHIIAKLGTNDKVYGQVPFVEQEEARRMARAIAGAWATEGGRQFGEAGAEPASRPGARGAGAERSDVP